MVAGNCKRSCPPVPVAFYVLCTAPLVDLVMRAEPPPPPWPPPGEWDENDSKYYAMLARMAATPLHPRDCEDPPTPWKIQEQLDLQLESLIEQNPTLFWYPDCVPAGLGPPPLMVFDDLDKSPCDKVPVNPCSSKPTATGF